MIWTPPTFTIAPTDGLAARKNTVSAESLDIDNHFRILLSITDCCFESLEGTSNDCHIVQYAVY